MVVTRKLFTEDCSLLFNGKSYDFHYPDSFYGNICCKSDLGLTLITIIAVILLDVVTLIKILTHRRTVLGESAISSGARNEREILFFKQSCLLGFTFAGNIVILTVHQFLFTNKWLIFASSTITFIMTLSMDG
uniref:7TM_GPCR_Srx domain-containing protein n=1 Tax=Onchocerca volvulus TaxID=6282 RepID=A0A8R1TN60_ONCVO